MDSSKYLKSASEGSTRHTSEDIQNINDINKTITITLDNVHKLSIFELRQEIQKRNDALVAPEPSSSASSSSDHDPNGSDIVSSQSLLSSSALTKGHDAMLQRMIQILYDEKEAKENYNKHNIITEQTTSKQEESLKDRLQRAKMERKKDAIERSKQRQLDKDYFEKKRIANKVGMKKCSHDKNDRVIDEDNGVRIDQGETTNLQQAEGCDNDDHAEALVKDNNPFKLRFRSKIGGTASML